MLEMERLEQIIQYMGKTQSATVKALADCLYISEATVRRDLTTLEKQGRVKRVYGGAVLLHSLSHEVPLYLRERQYSAEKRQIAARAAALVKNGQIIYMDASSTVKHLVPFLEDFQSLTVITNGLKTSFELVKSKHNIFCTGGLQLQDSYAYVGSGAIEFLRRFNADICFFSSRGVSDDGFITDSSLEETEVRHAMLKNSKTHVFLYDKSKLGTCYGCNLCHISEVDYAICNED